MNCRCARAEESRQREQSVILILCATGDQGGRSNREELTKHLKALEGVHAGDEIPLGQVEGLNVARNLAHDCFAFGGGISDGGDLREQVL